MIPYERAITIARIIHEQNEDVSRLFDRDERDAAKTMWNYLDNSECSCSDPDEEGTCWYRLTDEQQVQAMASLVT